MTGYSYRNDERVPDFDDAHPVIVFDGVCKLCNGWMSFVLRHDRAGRFRVMTAQSEVGEALFAHYDLKGEDYDTVLLLHEGQLYTESASWFRTLQLLGWPWKLAGIKRIVPAFIRDPLYRLIARNRYCWFGRRDSCAVPTAAQRAHFL